MSFDERSENYIPLSYVLEMMRIEKSRDFELQAKPAVLSLPYLPIQRSGGLLDFNEDILQHNTLPKALDAISHGA